MRILTPEQRARKAARRVALWATDPDKYRARDSARRVALGSSGREKNARRSATWRAANPEKVKAINARRAIKIREWHLNKKYGITAADVEDMRTQQAGKCKSCAGEGPLCVDHDHRTGKVRGLLCHPCNKALGLLKDSPVTIRRLADYIDGGAAVEEADRRVAIVQEKLDTALARIEDYRTELGL